MCATRWAPTWCRELFAAAPIEEGLRNALPPNLAPLAGPATAGLRKPADDNAPKVLGSAAALEAWRRANETGPHPPAQGPAKREDANGEVTLDLGGLATQVADSTGLPPAAVEKLPPDVAELTVLKSSQLATAQKAFNVLEKLPSCSGSSSSCCSGQPSGCRQTGGEPSCRAGCA